MTTKPKLSIIIPVYNTQNYLSKCFDSVLNQTFKDLEIIVVNDGSTDDSQKIIDDYAQNDSRIISIVKANGGLSDARNAGIEVSKGDFLAFIDSDDYIDASMFEEMLALAMEHQSQIVMCDLVKVDEDGTEFRDLPQSPQLPNKIILEEDFTIFGEMSCFACNKIYSKELFVNHRFLKGIHFEDIELIPKLLLDSTIVSKINKPFYKYFERKNSISKSHNIKGLDMFLAIENVTNYFNKSNYQSNGSELKRFQILQGYYSYLAYVAFVNDSALKELMLNCLKDFIEKNKLLNKEIKQYKRFNKVYKSTLSLKKRLYYELSFINLKILGKI
jgi:glycosyltransferase involved in cell wall biosynthesis